MLILKCTFCTSGPTCHIFLGSNRKIYTPELWELLSTLLIHQAKKSSMRTLNFAFWSNCASQRFLTTRIFRDNFARLYPNLGSMIIGTFHHLSTCSYEYVQWIYDLCTTGQTKFSNFLLNTINMNSFTNINILTILLSTQCTQYTVYTVYTVFIVHSAHSTKFT